MNCNEMYMEVNGSCIHYLWPVSFWSIFGTLMVAVAGGISLMAGIGGGAINISILISMLGYAPKQATFVVFACILGASTGNMLSQYKKSHNGEAVMKYEFAFASIPIMFSGSLIGVLLNKILPSLFICALLVGRCIISVNIIFKKFIVAYRKQSQQNLLNNDQQLIKQEQINPFNIQRNRYIAFNIIKIMLFYLFLLSIRGSQKFQSIVGVQPCSFLYWFINLFAFIATGWIAKNNIQTLAGWIQSPNQLKDTLVNLKQGYQRSLIENSFMAGIFSGFGVGGGAYLVPMYRQMGCNSFQATSTCNLGIFIGAITNCIQGVFFGMISISDVVYFFLVSSIGGYYVAKILSNELRKRNRLSMVEGLFIVLNVFTIINYPLSLWRQFANSNYNLTTVIGFGSMC